LAYDYETERAVERHKYRQSFSRNDTDVRGQLVTKLVRRQNRKYPEWADAVRWIWRVIALLGCTFPAFARSPQKFAQSLNWTDFVFFRENLGKFPIADVML
jgi:hypothetical protein